MYLWLLLFVNSIFNTGLFFLLLNHEVRQLRIDYSFGVRVVNFVVDSFILLSRLTFSECSLFDTGDFQIFAFQQCPSHLKSQPILPTSIIYAATYSTSLGHDAELASEPNE